MAKLLPYAAGLAAISGLCTAGMWPRVGVATLYSVAGLSLIVPTALMTARLRFPHWHTMVPATTFSQVMILLCLVAFGAIVQGRLAPAVKPASRPESNEAAKKS